jgi:hypothetical protein
MTHEKDRFPDGHRHPILSQWEPWPAYAPGQRPISDFIARQEFEITLRRAELAAARKYMIEQRRECTACADWALEQMARKLDLLGPGAVYARVSPDAFDGVEALLKLYERRSASWRAWTIDAWCDLWHARNDD